MAVWPYNTARWQRLRHAHLSLFPMCEGCEATKRLTLANTVDHRVAISDGGAPFPGHDGLASYCASCHGAKTARGNEAGAIRSSKPRKGCDADGNPTDPDHPWHGSRQGQASTNAYTRSKVRQEIAQGCTARTDHRHTNSISFVSSTDLGNDACDVAGGDAYVAAGIRHG